MTDNERVDIYHDSGRQVGIATRYEAHKKGLWHYNFHCWIATRRRGGALLFQVRSQEKPSFPGLLDSTVGGHYSAGEGLKEVMREIEEEIGIKVGIRKLVPLGKRLDVAFYGGMSKREIAQVFIMESDLPLTGYRISEEEVAGLVEVPIDSGLRLFSGRARRISSSGVMWQEAAKDWKRITMSLGQERFVPKLDAYYMSLFINAKRFLSGEKYLSI